MKILVLFAFLFSFICAHKLNIFLIEENENIIVSSYFASGSYCKNCKVEIYNLKNELIKEGITNKNGEYVFSKTDESLNIKVEAIGGHAAFEKFEISKEHEKKNKEVKTTKDSLIESFIAILLIAGIFLFLKKIKKS